VNLGWFRESPVLHALTTVAGAVLVAGAAATVLGGPRVLRLVAGEGIKLVSQRFLYVSILFLCAGVLLSAWLQPLLTGQKETEWSRFNSYQLFAYGAKFGNWMASYVLVVFSGMLFAGEFDRGTIKNLLTRPVTRTDLFLAKVLVAILFASFLYVVVIYVSYHYAVSRGDLGPVWDTQQYEMKRTAAEMESAMRYAIAVSFLPLLCASFFGILVSNLTESSGYAVATAVIAFFFADLTTGFLHPDTRLKFFNSYLTEGFEVLRRRSEGEGWPGFPPRVAPWFSESLYLKIPLLYMSAFLSTAYGIFRAKNIQA